MPEDSKEVKEGDFLIDLSKLIDRYEFEYGLNHIEICGCLQRKNFELLEHMLIVLDLDDDGEQREAN